MDPDVKVAVMVPVPVELPVASPLVVVIEATPDGEELQVTRLEMSCLVPSEKLPVAVNCCCVPTLIDGLSGDTLIETRDALVTVRVAVPETPLMLAVIVEVPLANAIVRPSTPLLFILATWV